MRCSDDDDGANRRRPLASWSSWPHKKRRRCTFCAEMIISLRTRNEMALPQCQKVIQVMLYVCAVRSRNRMHYGDVMWYTMRNICHKQAQIIRTPFGERWSSNQFRSVAFQIRAPFFSPFLLLFHHFHRSFRFLGTVGPWVWAFEHEHCVRAKWDTHPSNWPFYRCSKSFECR